MLLLRSGIIAFVAFAYAASASAQPAPPAPAESALPPPLRAESAATDPELEPQVTIIRRDGETFEEVRVNGELRYIKVTPRLGPPYYLVPNGSSPTFIRRESLDFGLVPPMWLLFSW